MIATDTIDLTNRWDFLTTKFSETPLTNAPTISIPPRSQAVPEGSNVLLTVTAAGIGPFTYDWFKNGRQQYPPNLTPTLLATNIRSGRAAEYFVQVRNAYGVVTSPTARVSVAPLIDDVAILPKEGARFTVRGEVNSYWIETSMNLLDWTILTNFYQTNGSSEITNARPPAPVSFYRVSRNP